MRALELKLDKVEAVNECLKRERNQLRMELKEQRAKYAQRYKQQIYEEDLERLRRLDLNDSSANASPIQGPIKVPRQLKKSKSHRFSHERSGSDKKVKFHSGLGPSDKKHRGNRFLLDEQMEESGND
mmetsp:Transcript_16991/g.28729  ORF Transcript_16991/g.28729 Transcript_16991/m.28729 type:complete len:127 (+) Transcript_16991:61-441(+)